MDGWKITFLLGRPIFRGYVSFREGICWTNLRLIGHNKQPPREIVATATFRSSKGCRVECGASREKTRVTIPYHTHMLHVWYIYIITYICHTKQPKVNIPLETDKFNVKEALKAKRVSNQMDVWKNQNF